MTAIEGAGTLRFTGSPYNVDEAALNSLKNIGQVLTSYLEGVGPRSGNPPPTNAPRLDEPTLGADMSDLAGLLLKLQNKTTEVQLSFSQQYIETNKKELEQKHRERIDKLLESFDKMKDAEKSGLAGKIFGWIAAAVLVIAAVAACVATGGIAIGPVVGALLAVGMMVMQETGAMDEIMKGLVDLMKKMGLGEPAAQILAAIAMMVVMIAISLAVPSGATAAIGKIASMTGNAGKMVQGTMTMASMANLAEKFGTFAKTAINVSKFGMIFTQVGSATTGAISGVSQSNAMDAQADAQAIQKFLTKLQQRMEEEQDKIKDLIEQLQNSVGIVMDIMKSEAEMKSTIAQQMRV